MSRIRAGHLARPKEMKNSDDILDPSSIYRPEPGNHHAIGERGPQRPHSDPARLVERLNDKQAHHQCCKSDTWHRARACRRWAGSALKVIQTKGSEAP